jgi:hypothetical protein
LAAFRAASFSFTVVSASLFAPAASCLSLRIVSAFSSLSSCSSVIFFIISSMLLSSPFSLSPHVLTIVISFSPHAAFSPFQALTACAVRSSAATTASPIATIWEGGEGATPICPLAHVLAGRRGGF